MGSPRSTVRRGALARTAMALTTSLFAAACADATAPLAGPEGSSLVARDGHTGGNAPVCSVIDFNQFTHGQAVTSVTAAGVTFNVSGVGYVLPDGSPNTYGGAKAFDTDATEPRDTDMQWNTTGARCPDCEGLREVLVIESEKGFFGEPIPSGDATYGGALTFTPTTAGTYYIQSFTAVDQEDINSNEQRLRLFLDGSATPAATAAGLGDGSVQTVMVPTGQTFTTSFELRLGTIAADNLTGSGAVDNISVCRVVEEGPGTGTPGYWKNHPEAWPVSSLMVGAQTYTVAQAIAVMNQPTRGDKTYNLFEQLVAAKLNVLVGNEDSCIASTIAAADAFLTTHPVGSGVSASSSAWTSTGAGLLTMLDDYNNGRLCADSRD